MKDVDVEFDTGVYVAAVKQVGEFCSLAVGRRGGITDIIGTNNGTGEQIHFPLGPSTRVYRLLCSKLPAGIAVQVVVAVLNADPSDLTERKPKEVRFHAKYKARMRPYDITVAAVPQDLGAH